ncbi:C4-dicarboxylate transport protein [Anoxybacillus sp. BCO1]|nr:C4-dicarboxylate transport protein [Anoxybacillus sp. BCO1]
MRVIVEQANDLLMYLVEWVMKFAPYGAFALIAIAIGGQGFDAIAAMGKYMFAVLLALFIHFFVVYGTAVWTLGKMSLSHLLKDFLQRWLLRLVHRAAMLRCQCRWKQHKKI